MTDKLARILTTESIRHECSQSNLARAESYYAQKRLVEFTITQDQGDTVSITSKVKGTTAIPYKQLINIKWQADQQGCRIVGQCTCPMGYNCKHVATACLEYQSLLELASPVNTKACFEWLENFHNPVAHAEQNVSTKEFIIYLLATNPTNRSLHVRAQITRFKLNGQLAKPRDINLSSIRYTLNYGNAAPPFLNEIDQEILKLLLSSGTYAHPLPIRDWAGGLALEKMLRTERLYCEDTDSPALQRGELRPLSFKWQLLDTDAYHLEVGTKPEALIVPTEPVYYLDNKLKQLGAIDYSGLNHLQLQKLLAVPPVPKQVADEFSDRLLMDFPQLNLPTPTKLSLLEVTNLKPTPRLTLQGGADKSQRYTHQLQLNFDYGEYQVPGKANDDFSLIQTDAGYLRIKRDLGFEQQCQQLILDCGFTPTDLFSSVHCLYLSLNQHSQDNGQLWYDFLNIELPALESEGWIVNYDPSFLIDFQMGEDWDAEFHSSENDWFEMSFTVDIDGKKFSLLPLLIPVLQNFELADLPESVTLSLGNHQYLTIASAKLKPFIEILYELFDRGTLLSSDTLKLSRFDIATIAELELNSYGVFAIKGGEAIRALSQKIKNFTGIADVGQPTGLQAELRSYQQQGLNWLQFLREYQFGGILADDMGLGKTLQTLAHLLLEKQAGRMTKPSLIIAPTSLMSNWRREAERFTPDLSLLVLQGLERRSQFDKIQDYDVLLTTYPLLPRDEEFLLAQDYYYLILDEAQIVKNPNAKAAKVVRFLKAEHRLCLTGTPMENHLGELWAQFDFLMPGFLGDRNDFRQRYRTPIETNGDDEQRNRLHRRIKPFMLRRTKVSVLAELPAKTEIIRSVPLSPKQAGLYETIRLTMEQKVQAAIAEKGLARSHITILDALLKLRQTCCDPRILPLQEAKKVKESAKLDLLMEILPELLEEGRRILVFSQFTRMLTIIETELDKLAIPYCKLTGQTQKREEVIEQFKNGEADVFLISLKAGGVGLNLTEADTVIIYDPWWNPAAETQAADRAYRLGQDKPVFVYKLITENTVEEKIIAMQAKKRALADGIYDNQDQQEAVRFSAEDLTALFSME